ncbi:MAG: bifunctional phosphopantothenoylcysteine decarboxylase/phosphopantothenate--cysteine ligase CoaBC [Chloroflexota bacterium]|nr:MAG: bifunctional phosphopantothenoylcysteine decarboxylase/phosphopantothenate--cysteine ligase CoaBC [Chloroflexota bacterium]
MNVFLNKTIVLGVTGSIAAYKAATLASRLHQVGAHVHVAMTDAAAHFVAPLTFESLTHHPVLRDVLALGADSEIEHVSFAKRAHLVLIAPATANTIAKLAHGFANDVISAICLDTRAPILLAPAMETGMWENAATQENIAVLKRRGVIIIEPDAGHLASGASGKGRMAEPSEIIDAVRHVFALDGSMAGKRVVITAGGTREAIDPVRVISNHSSGKMGYALAEEALARGANVALITSVQELPIPYGANVTRVISTRDLFDAVLREGRGADVLIMAAAPADFRPASAAEQKIKKEAAEDLTIHLVRNPDILGEVARVREQNPANAPRVAVGFAAETNDLIDNARAKLERKGLDMIVANPVPQTFGSDNVKATLLLKNHTELDLEPMSKENLAAIILDQAENFLKQK